MDLSTRWKKGTGNSLHEPSTVIETFINVKPQYTSMLPRKKAHETHAKEALRDMIPPQDPLSNLMEGERDLDDLLNNSTKKVKKKGDTTR